jgi:hypothetical protein
MVAEMPTPLTTQNQPMKGLKVTTNRVVSVSAKR